jgi:hypothetical protein
MIENFGSRWLTVGRAYYRSDSPAMLALIQFKDSDTNVCDLQNGGAQL